MESEGMIEQVLTYCLEPLAYALYFVLVGAWRAIPLLVIVLSIDFTLSRRIAPRFQCLLWALVLFRMLCPISVGSPFSVQGRFDQWGIAAVEYFETAMPDETTHVARSLEFDTYTFEQDGKVITLPLLPPDATEEYRAEARAYVDRLIEQNGIVESQANFGQTLYVTSEPVGDPQFGILVGDWETILAVGMLVTWVIGACFLLLRNVVAHLRFARMLKGCKNSTDPDVRQQIELVCQRLRVRRIPRVKEVEGLMIPAVFGLFRPVVCLPRTTVQELTAEELGWVLMHEVSHVKRRDTLLMSLAAVVRPLQWFNPMAHLAFSRLRHFIEQAADDLATRSLPDRSPSEYGHLLLRFAAEPSELPRGVTMGLLFVSSTRHLRRRIDMLNCNTQRNRPITKVVALSAILVASVTGMTDAKMPLTSAVDLETDSTTWQATESENDRPLAPSLPPQEPDRGPVTTVSYDVSAALKKLSEEDSSMKPEISLAAFFARPTQDMQYELPQIKDSKLTLTQDAEAHIMAKLLLRSIELFGVNQQVTIEIRILEADPSIASAIDWKGRSTMATRPRSERESFSAEIAKLVEESSEQETIALQASDGSYRNRPMYAVKVSEQQLKLLLHRAQQDDRSNIAIAPKVTLFCGQVASITDQSQRPFVTGLKMEEELGSIPVVETVVVGWELNIYAEPTDDGRVQLHGLLAESKLKGVELANLPFLEQDAVVQVPHVSEVSASVQAQLDDGQSLLILSPETYDPKHKPQNQSARFYVLTPRLIDVSAVAEAPRAPVQ